MKEERSFYSIIDFEHYKQRQAYSYSQHPQLENSPSELEQWTSQSEKEGFSTSVSESIKNYIEQINNTKSSSAVAGAIRSL